MKLHLHIYHKSVRYFESKESHGKVRTLHHEAHHLQSCYKCTISPVQETLQTCMTVWSYEDFKLNQWLKALVLIILKKKKEREREASLVMNLTNDLVKISATTFSVIFSLVLQQIPAQYPKQAISASFLIHLVSSYTTNFLQLKGHYEITNHRNTKMSYAGNLFCQWNKYRLQGGINTSSCVVQTNDTCFSSNLWHTVALISNTLLYTQQDVMCQDLEVMFDVQCKKCAQVRNQILKANL